MLSKCLLDEFVVEGKNSSLEKKLAKNLEMALKRHRNRNKKGRGSQW